MDKELRDRLYWLAEELTEEERELLFDDVETVRELPFEDAEEEPEYIAPPRRKPTQAELQERRQLQRTDPIEQRSAPVVKKKGIKGLVFLAVLEITGILILIGWWLQWLI